MFEPAQTKHSFAPVVDEHVRVLMLGSLPGEESLARAQYYANPRNHFWRLMSAVIEADLVPLSYGERLEALLAARVGLWDSVGSAKRSGSLDAAIKGHKPNSLSALAAGLPQLRAVAFNGGTSARIGRAQLAGADGAIDLVDLPSSSPANARLSFDQKLARWSVLARYLD